MKTRLWGGRGNHHRNFGRRENFFGDKRLKITNQPSNSGIPRWKGYFLRRGGWIRVDLTERNPQAARHLTPYLQVVGRTCLGWKFLNLLSVKTPTETRRDNLGPLTVVGDWP